MTVLILVSCIAGLVVLITWAKVNPFLAFLLISMLAALLLGIPLNGISQTINRGLGDMLGSILIVIVLGAMVGKLVAESGAAQRIGSVLRNLFGEKHMVWAMTLTGFIVGIPLFYTVGFILLVPIIFSVSNTSKLPLVYVGLPMLASLSVMHGFLPPHPSPIALVALFKADMATVFFYGMIIAIPAIVVAGPLFSRTLKNIKSNSLKVFSVPEIPEEQLPGVVNSFASSLLPVLIIGATALLSRVISPDSPFKGVATFLAEPNMVMVLTIVIATYTLGIRLGKRLGDIMKSYVEAVKDTSMILLIIGSAGMLKQVLVDSGVGDEIANGLQGWALPPLLLAWVVTAVLRLSLGSATVAGLTAAGIIYPLTLQTPVEANLLVLSVGAGSLFCSHVNDPGFWLFKEYFGLTMKDTFRSWTLMESLVSVIGLIGVLIVDQLFF